MAHSIVTIKSQLREVNKNEIQEYVVTVIVPKRIMAKHIPVPNSFPNNASCPSTMLKNTKLLLGLRTTAFPTDYVHSLPVAP